MLKLHEALSQLLTQNHLTHLLSTLACSDPSTGHLCHVMRSQYAGC